MRPKLLKRRLRNEDRFLSVPDKGPCHQEKRGKQDRKRTPGGPNERSFHHPEFEIPHSHQPKHAEEIEKQDHEQLPAKIREAVPCQKETRRHAGEDQPVRNTPETDIRCRGHGKESEQ